MTPTLKSRSLLIWLTTYQKTGLGVGGARTPGCTLKTLAAAFEEAPEDADKAPDSSLEETRNPDLLAKELLGDGKLTPGFYLVDEGNTGSNCSIAL